MFSVKLYDNHIRGELISLLPLRVNPLKENEFISLLLPLEIRMEKEFSTVGHNSLIEAEKGDIVLFKRKELIIIDKEIILDNNNNEYNICLIGWGSTVWIFNNIIWEVGTISFIISITFP